MISWPDTDETLLRRYVDQKGFRTKSGSEGCCSVLRSFQRFISKRGSVSPSSRENVTAWVQDCISRWRLRMAIWRAQVVNGFLDWLQNGGHIAQNPFAALRIEFQQHTTAPIVRALADRDPASALEKLRSLPRFGSHLGSTMREYLALMRATGARCKGYENRFLAFDRFLQQPPDASKQPLNILVQRWMESASRPELQLERLEVGRLVARALQRTDPSVVIPRLDRRLSREVRRRLRKPYIFTVQDVSHLLNVARAFPSPHAPLRPQVLYTMLVLAYCAGLRLGELSRLQIGDIDFGDGSIAIRESKFFKTRRLPLSVSALAALRTYLDARKGAGAPPEKESALFWHQHACRGYSRTTIELLLTRVFRKAALKPPYRTGRLGPRIHDLRHTFVVHRMTEWYQKGINPELLLPYLATYLGHKSIHSTLVYLTITQELLRQANDRFHSLGARLLQVEKEVVSR